VGGGLSRRARRAVDGGGDADGYARVVRLRDGTLATLAVRRTRDAAGYEALAVAASPAMPRAALTALVVRLFDLDADLDAFHAMARDDTLLGPVVASNPHGIRLPQLLDPFEALVRAVLGQQVSVAAATTMTDRLVRLVGHPAPATADGPTLAFPRADEVAAHGADGLRGIGLTGAKAATIAGVATAVASGALDLHAARAAPADEALRMLVALPGIGPWTASYVRMRALGDRDAFPSGDLGVRKALARHGVTGRAVDEVAERWRPWRGYATLHLWHSLSHSA